jgi:hypothetical protein
MGQLVVVAMTCTCIRVVQTSAGLPISLVFLCCSGLYIIVPWKRCDLLSNHYHHPILRSHFTRCHTKSVAKISSLNNQIISSSNCITSAMCISPLNDLAIRNKYYYCATPSQMQTCKKIPWAYEKCYHCDMTPESRNSEVRINVHY